MKDCKNRQSVRGIFLQELQVSKNSYLNRIKKVPT